MEVQAAYTAFSELLTQALEKIRKYLNSKKFKNLRENCNQALEQIKVDQTLDANKYFPIFKLALDSKNTKVLEHTLYYTQKLISHGFLTGNCDDNCQYSEPPQLISQRYPRKLIDAIVESVCSCVHERDDNVQLQVIKTILTIITSFNTEVHDRTLLEAFRACYHIHITSKNLVNQTTAKATLTQMLHFVFQRMESSSVGLNEESLNIVIKGIVRTMIDDVVLYDKKNDKNIPIRSVPYMLDPDDPSYKAIVQVEEINEDGIPAGKFGWCVVCRKAANFYCKDMREPVCSEACKKSNLRNYEKAELSLVGDEDNDYLFDAIITFRSICKLSLKELPTSMSSVTFRSKVLSLELILAVLDNPGPVFCTRKQFVEIIRGSLCESLMNNSISTDKTIFALSLSIFVALVNNFKDTLKTEIGIFMDNIFIKLLESENASYNQKLLVIEVFYRITQNPKTTLELFLNYDCDVEEKDIFGRMIDILGKIAVGRYKSSSNLQPQQELSLRSIALETVTNIMTVQVVWLEKENGYQNKNTEHMNSEELSDTVSDSGSEATNNFSIASDQFEKNKQLKSCLSRAVSKFNINPAQGIKFLDDNGYLNSNSPQEIATFLKLTPGIDKTMLGDYLGRDKDLNSQVLYEFIHLHSFQGIDLVEAIRIFLTSFRIPGEGQKIDKIMQTFAEKYYKDNPEKFSTADSVYVLSFAIMMLQTDLHNPANKNKMTLSGFIMINTGIDQGKDLDHKYLEEIYNNVKDHPFTLEEDEEARDKLEMAGLKKQELYAKESEKMLNKGHNMIKKARKSTVYHEATDIDYLKTMFNALWHPLLATFSIILEESDDPKFWRLCMQGYLACIKISCRFGMTLEIEIFLSSLAKFTSLIYLNNLITEKNIECVKLLLEIAKLEANCLKGSWVHVIKCLSKLDHLHLLNSGAEYDGPATELEIHVSESISAQISPDEIDYIFNMSAGLDDDNIVEFVSKLVEVSKEELWNEHPQTFCLQALVNVADVNMNRIRYVWSRLWTVLKEHFYKSGLHHNQFIAIFAVDSLKQLAIKFLQKEESTNFHFQKEFLYPFDLIFKQSQNAQVKELVVACMCTFVFTLVHNIHSGWHNIFEVFQTAAKYTSGSIPEQAFQAISMIIEKHLGLVSENIQELVNCLCLFTGNSNEIICIKSFDLMSKCIEEILNEKIQPGFLYTLISAIAGRVSDPREQIRLKALENLFGSLKRIDGKYNEEQWKVIYSGILLPIFDDFQYGSSSDKEWVHTTCQQTFKLVVQLLTESYNHLSFLIPDFLEMLGRGVSSLHEQLAKISILTIKSLAEASGANFNEIIWVCFLSKFEELLKITTPYELRDDLIEGKLTFDIALCLEKCIIQRQLIEACNDIGKKFVSKFPLEPSVKFISILEEVYNYSRNYDNNISHRTTLWQAGFLGDINTLPGLFNIEKESLSCILNYLFEFSTKDLTISEKIYTLSKILLTDIINKDQLGAERKQEITNLEPIIANQLLPGLSKNIKEAASKIGAQIVDLIVVDDLRIREEVRKFFKEYLLITR
ncbi:unnamed protein product [Blepharisma stoltei]|uniref:SEC7 domain-containing protein n=1 Tax=Blepharisma stoltei TaxID=1481888 RepID=A0AAU9KCN8_9CILI|nr:unnamed protein product [Blepharisma stoltei]